MKITNLFLIVCFIIVSCGLTAQNYELNIYNKAIKDSFPVNIPLLFQLEIINNTNNVYEIDSNCTDSVEIHIASGQHVLEGTTKVHCRNGKPEFTDCSFSQTGVYDVFFTSGNITSDTLKEVHIADIFTLSDQSATSLTAMYYLDTFNFNPQNFYVYLIAFDAAGNIDTTYSDSAHIKTINGQATLSGKTAIKMNKGIGIFHNLNIDDEGMYALQLSSNNMSDTINIYLSSQTNFSEGCGSVEGERDNLGLYGASVNDLTFCATNNRLFATVMSPASLFYSDDMGDHWIAAFPEDSLEIECDKTGWGGGGTQVLANSKGWVAARIKQEGGTIQTSVMSLNEGDTGTWKTIVNEYILQQKGYTTTGNMSSIALSNNFLYTIMGSMIVISDSLGNIKEVQDVNNYINNLPSVYLISNIAAASSSSGFPYYIIVQNDSSKSNAVYKFDGISFSEITLPESFSNDFKIYTLHEQATGDTLFISGYITGSNSGAKIYRSFNSGATWSLINNDGQLLDIEYSSGWLPKLTSSNGNILLSGGGYISYDLGETWKKLNNNGLGFYTVHPNDTSLFISAGNYDGIYKSIGGINGGFARAANQDLEALGINEISGSTDKSIYYIATKAGLAFTTVYSDTSIKGSAKYKPPYGRINIGLGINDSIEVITAVEISPFNNNHVLAAIQSGMSCTFSGYGGFVFVDLSLQDNEWLSDIEFVNQNVAIAVAATYDGMGHIFKTTDGGINWNEVTPSNLGSANCVAVAANGSDTVLYVGTGTYLADTGYLWVSTDLGSTWNVQHIGPNAVNDATVGLPINDIAIKPGTTDTLYVAAGGNLSNAFAKSYDGGLSYEYVALTGEGSFTSVLVNPESPDTIYAAIRRELYMYNEKTDQAYTLFKGLPGELIPDLEFGSLLAGTSTGFYSIELEVIDDIVTYADSDDSSNKNVKIYPNPSKDLFSIRGNKNALIKAVQIFDITGNLVYSEHFDIGKNEVVVNTFNLPSGLFLIKIETHQGEIIYQKQVISK